MPLKKFTKNSCLFPFSLYPNGTVFFFGQTDKHAAALVNFLGYWAGKLPGLLRLVNFLGTLVNFLGYWAGKLPGLLGW